MVVIVSRLRVIVTGRPGDQPRDPVRDLRTGDRAVRGEQVLQGTEPVLVVAPRGPFGVGPFPGANAGDQRGLESTPLDRGGAAGPSIASGAVMAPKPWPPRPARPG